MRRHRLLALAAPLFLLISILASPPVGAASGVGVVPQGFQDDKAYAGSYAAKKVTNVFATSQLTSCYTPEVPYFGNLGPANAYTGMSACTGATPASTATTGENLGPYRSQAGSNPGYPAHTPMLVKNHSESDLRVDPTNSKHLIGTSKWAVSAEGYNHLLGFFESFDGGFNWTVQGHIPGYEGWTDNTDPVGAFDGYGNFYALILPYQFYYNSDGTHNFHTNPQNEPNPSLPAEAITIAVRPAGSTLATDWSSSTQMDIIASYPSRGREPDKQWITIDTNPASPFYNRIYAMWVVFDSLTAVPLVSYADANADGTHTPWSKPQRLPTAGKNPQGDTYLLPHADPSGVVYTTLTNFTDKSTLTTILLDRSTDGGATWESVSTVVRNVTAPPAAYANTNFRDGIENSFAVGPKKVNGQYPLYVAWEDYSAGVGNLILSGSFDGGITWSSPIQINDNTSKVDAFQPNLTTAASGKVLVAFYDRRLPCPSMGTPEAAGAGLTLDTTNLKPPHDALNYCINASLQTYEATLIPIGHNIRISQYTWDPQLNSMKPSSINRARGFIGDYFGIDTAGTTVYTTSVSTYDDGSNPRHFQQQVVASLTIP
jgi:hypothetical protein